MPLLLQLKGSQRLGAKLLWWRHWSAETKPTPGKRGKSLEEVSKLSELFCNEVLCVPLSCVLDALLDYFLKAFEILKKARKFRSANAVTGIPYSRLIWLDRWQRTVRGVALGCRERMAKYLENVGCPHCRHVNVAPKSPTRPHFPY